MNIHEQILLEYKTVKFGYAGITDVSLTTRKQNAFRENSL